VKGGGEEPGEAGTLMMMVPEGSLLAGANVCDEVVKPVYVAVRVTKGPVNDD
jgi:hypothetical protein